MYVEICCSNRSAEFILPLIANVLRMISISLIPTTDTEPNIKRLYQKDFIRNTGIIGAVVTLDARFAK
jgi:hypothetical protein